MGLLKKIKIEIKWAECLHSFHRFPTSEIPISVFARLKCQNCGNFGRHPTCPPNTPTYEQCKTFFKSFKKALVIVFKDDGTKSWSEGESSVKLIKRRGRQLKGVEAGMSRYMRRKMFELRSFVENRGYFAEVFLSGHCMNGLCGKKNCPIKGNRKEDRSIDCPFDGTRSLESVCVDCFNLLDLLNIPHDVVVENDVTLVSMLLYRKGDGIHLQKDLIKSLKMRDSMRRLHV